MVESARGGGDGDDGGGDGDDISVGGESEPGEVAE